MDKSAVSSGVKTSQYTRSTCSRYFGPWPVLINREISCAVKTIEYNCLCRKYLPIFMSSFISMHFITKLEIWNYFLYRQTSPFWYINNLLKCSSSLNFIFFADDTNMIYSNDAFFFTNAVFCKALSNGTLHLSKGCIVLKLKIKYIVKGSSKF